MSIDLNSAGDNSDYEMQVLGDSAVSNSTTINMEDAESEDSANLPGVEVSDGLALISVSHDDESKFTPEEWAKILQQIEQGTVYWED